jgi:hypothetical protein
MTIGSKKRTEERGDLKGQLTRKRGRMEMMMARIRGTEITAVIAAAMLVFVTHRSPINPIRKRHTESWRSAGRKAMMGFIPQRCKPSKRFWRRRTLSRMDERL